MKTKILIIFLLLLLPLVKAQEFSDYKLEISLKPSGIVHEKIQANFVLDHQSDSIIFSKVNEIRNIKVYENGKSLNFADTEEGILIYKNFLPGKLNQITIEFDTNDLVKKSGKDFIFSLDLSIPKEVKNLDLNLDLPEGFVLSDIESSVSPKASEVSTDGKVISVDWYFKDIKEQSFIVIYKRGFESKSEPFFLVYGLIMFIILLSISIFIIFIYKKNNRKFVMSTLSSDEREIVKFIREDKGVTQKKISQLAGFSKSKMSKLVRRLEEKEIIKKTPWFETNKFNLSRRLR